jgi:Right handed beta helix region
MSPRRLLTAASGALATLALIAGPAAPAQAASDCDAVAAPAGSDSAAGSLASPYRSASKLVGSLAPGETGCFRAGSYPFATLSVKTAGVTLTSYGSERAVLAGHLKILPGAHDSVIEGLVLDASSSPDNTSGPKVYASGVVLRENEITNRHTAICIMVGSYYDEGAPEGIVIERNRIHHCGELPSTNLHHGIYLSEARNTVIRDNWIYENTDRGIQQYPNVTGSLISGNVIAQNGDGINFSGTGSSVTRNATVWGNIVVDSKLGHNAYSGGDGPNGTNNLFRDNCVRAKGGGSGIESTARSFDARANLVAQPRFVDAGSYDFRLEEGSECFAKYTGTMSGAGNPDPDPDPDPGSGKPSLETGRKKVRKGASFRLHGTVAAPAVTHVAIERRRDGVWKRVGAASVQADGSFVERVRAHGKRRRMVLRASVGDGTTSSIVRVRVRH